MTTIKQDQILNQANVRQVEAAQTGNINEKMEEAESSEPNYETFNPFGDYLQI
jgi:hypothetical protein